VIEQIYAMARGGQSSGGSATILTLLPFILIFFIFYFLMIRPQAKRQKETRVMLDSLKKGDKILTMGGIFGTIVGFKENENIVILKIDQNTKIEILRTSISKLIGHE
jgi:preprotein translocase subunit YajC